MTPNRKLAFVDLLEKIKGGVTVKTERATLWAKAASTKSLSCTIFTLFLYSVDLVCMGKQNVCTAVLKCYIIFCLLITHILICTKIANDRNKTKG